MLGYIAKLGNNLLSFWIMGLLLGSIIIAIAVGGAILEAP